MSDIQNTFLSGGRNFYDGDSRWNREGFAPPSRNPFATNTPRSTTRLDGLDAPEMANFERGALLSTGAADHAWDQGFNNTRRRGADVHGRTLENIVDGEGNDLSYELIAAGHATPTTGRLANGLHMQAPYADAARNIFGANSALDNDEEWVRLREQARVARIEGFLENAHAARANMMGVAGNARAPQRAGAFGRAMERGWDNTTASLYAVTQALGQVTGIDPIERWGEQGMQARLWDAMTNPAVINRYDDIDGLADAFTYFVETLGEEAPSLALDVAMGLTGAGMGAVAARRTAAGLAKSGLRAVAGNSSPQTASRFVNATSGARFGAFSSMYAQQAGGTQLRLNEEGIEAPGTAFGIGLTKAAVEYASAAAILRAVGLNTLAGRATPSAPNYSGNALARFGQGAASGIAMAAPAEGAKEGINFLQDELAVWLNNPEHEILGGEDAVKDWLDSMIRGSLLGGTVAGAGRGAHATFNAPEEQHNELHSPTRDSGDVGPTGGGITPELSPASTPNASQAAIGDATQSTTPEPASDLRAQVDARGVAYASPDNLPQAQAVAAELGTELTPVADGGALITRADHRLTPEQQALTQDASEQAKATALGFSESKTDVLQRAEEQGVEPVVVTATNAAGNVLTTEVTTPDRADQVANKVQAELPDAKVEVANPDDVQQQRSQAVKKEQSKVKIDDRPAPKRKETDNTAVQPVITRKRGGTVVPDEGQVAGVLAAMHPEKPIGQELRAGQLTGLTPEQAANAFSNIEFNTFDRGILEASDEFKSPDSRRAFITALRQGIEQASNDAKRLGAIRKVMGVKEGRVDNIRAVSSFVASNPAAARMLFAALSGSKGNTKQQNYFAPVQKTTKPINKKVVDKQLAAPKQTKETVAKQQTSDKDSEGTLLADRLTEGEVSAAEVAATELAGRVERGGKGAKQARIALRKFLEGESDPAMIEAVLDRAAQALNESKDRTSTAHDQTRLQVAIANSVMASDAIYHALGSMPQQAQDALFELMVRADIKGLPNEAELEAQIKTRMANPSDPQGVGQRFMFAKGVAVYDVRHDYANGKAIFEDGLKGAEPGKHLRLFLTAVGALNFHTDAKGNTKYAPTLEPIHEVGMREFRNWQQLDPSLDPSFDPTISRTYTARQKGSADSAAANRSDEEMAVANFYNNMNRLRARSDLSRVGLVDSSDKSVLDAHTVITFDFETFRDETSGYSLAKMSTEDYLNDSRFEAQMVTFKERGQEGVKRIEATRDTMDTLRVEFQAVVDQAAAQGKPLMLVAHNAPFDAAVLERIGVRLPEGARIVDTVFLARNTPEIMSRVPNASLDSLVQYGMDEAGVEGLTPKELSALNNVDGLQMADLLASTNGATAAQLEAYRRYAESDTANLEALVEHLLTPTQQALDVMDEGLDTGGARAVLQTHFDDNHVKNANARLALLGFGAGDKASGSRSFASHKGRNPRANTLAVAAALAKRDGYAGDSTPNLVSIPTKVLYGREGRYLAARDGDAAVFDLIGMGHYGATEASEFSPREQAIRNVLGNLGRMIHGDNYMGQDTNVDSTLTGLLAMAPDVQQHISLDAVVYIDPKSGELMTFGEGLQMLLTPDEGAPTPADITSTRVALELARAKQHVLLDALASSTGMAELTRLVETEANPQLRRAYEMKLNELRGLIEGSQHEAAPSRQLDKKERAALDDARAELATRVRELGAKAQSEDALLVAVRGDKKAQQLHKRIAELSTLEVGNSELALRTHLEGMPSAIRSKYWKTMSRLQVDSDAGFTSVFLKDATADVYAAMAEVGRYSQRMREFAQFRDKEGRRVVADDVTAFMEERLKAILVASGVVDNASEAYDLPGETTDAEYGHIDRMYAALTPGDKALFDQMFEAWDFDGENRYLDAEKLDNDALYIENRGKGWGQIEIDNNGDLVSVEDESRAGEDATDVAIREAQERAEAEDAVATRKSDVDLFLEREEMDRIKHNAFRHILETPRDQRKQLVDTYGQDLINEAEDVHTAWVKRFYDGKPVQRVSDKKVAEQRQNKLNRMAKAAVKTIGEIRAKAAELTGKNVGKQTQDQLAAIRKKEAFFGDQHVKTDASVSASGRMARLARAVQDQFNVTGTKMFITDGSDPQAALRKVFGKFADAAVSKYSVEAITRGGNKYWAMRVGDSFIIGVDPNKSGTVRHWFASAHEIGHAMTEAMILFNDDAVGTDTQLETLYKSYAAKHDNATSHGFMEWVADQAALLAVEQEASTPANTSFLGKLTASWGKLVSGLRKALQRADLVIDDAYRSFIADRQQAATINASGTRHRVLGRESYYRIDGATEGTNNVLQQGRMAQAVQKATTGVKQSWDNGLLSLGRALVYDTTGRIAHYSPRLAAMFNQRPNAERGQDGPGWQQQHQFLSERLSGLWAQVSGQIERPNFLTGSLKQREKVEQAIREHSEGKDTEGARIIGTFVSNAMSEAKKMGLRTLDGDKAIIAAFNHTELQNPAARAKLVAMIDEAGMEFPGQTTQEVVEGILDSRGMVEFALNPGKPLGMHANTSEIFAKVGTEKLREAGLLVDQNEVMLQHWIQGLAKRAAWEGTFGDFVAVEDMTTDPKGYLERLAGKPDPAGKAAIEAGLARKGGSGLEMFVINAKLTQELDAIEQTHGFEARAEIIRGLDHASGRTWANVPRGFRQAQEGLSAWTLMTTMMYAGVASIPEMGMAMSRANLPVANVVRALKNAKEGHAIAKALGVIQDAAAERSAYMMAGEGFESNVLGKGLHLFFKATGLQAMTNMSRAIGMSFASEAISYWADSADTQALDKLGLTLDDVAQYQALKAQYGRPHLLWHEVGSADQENVRKINNAMQQFVDESTAVPNKFQGTFWMNNPWLRTFAMVKRFFWSIADVVVGGLWRQGKSVWQKHADKGKVERAIRAAIPAVVGGSVLLVLGGITDWLRRLIREWNLGRPLPEQTTGQQFMGAVARAGIGGPAELVLSMRQQMEWGGSAIGASNIVIGKLEAMAKVKPETAIRHAIPVFAQNPRLWDAIVP